jgi:pimeloyl-ACP methyl ester carboxylesterase
MTNPTPLILLHGALGSRDQMAPLQQLLATHRDVHILNLHGHGGEPIPAQGYRMSDIVAQVVQTLQSQFTEPVDIFGYSMGGYAAAVVAAHHPGLIRSLVTLGTKWAWSPEIAAGELRMLDPSLMQEKAPALIALISARHAPQSWSDVVAATRFLLEDLGHQPLLTKETLQQINIPVTILRGEADRMVSQEESMHTAGLIPHATYAELPGQKHPFEQVDLQHLPSYLA